MIRLASSIISHIIIRINVDALKQRMTDNTDGLLLWVPSDAFSPLEIWCGTPTGAEVILAM
jgi:hypothetical protein